MFRRTKIVAVLGFGILIGSCGGGSSDGPTTPPTVTPPTTPPTTPPAATRLAIQTQPVGGGTTGSALTVQPAIEIRDDNGTKVASSTAQVVAAITSGGNGTLTGTLTVSAVAGVATFTDLKISGIPDSSRTITFSSSGLSSAVSEKITVRSPVITATITLFAAERAYAEPGRSLLFAVRAKSSDGSAVACTLDIDGNGSIEVTLPTCPDTVLALTYASSGSYTARLNASTASETASSTFGVDVGAASLSTGMDAAFMLAGKGFNNSGGASLFNHQSGLASDGTRLYVADRNNNRVLVWNTAPTGNTAPDFVLGQSSFSSNDPGEGLGGMNWPLAIGAAGGKLVVADAYNDRVLVWTSAPSSTGTAASFELTSPELKWPWGVWTNGTKLIVTSTILSKVLIWNTFPTSGSQAPDAILTGGVGTPRSITSNGVVMAVGDHNPQGFTTQGNFFWASIPTASGSNTHSYFRSNPDDANYSWMQGDFTTDGRLLMFGKNVYQWPTFPATATTSPGFTISGSALKDAGGDGSDLRIAAGRVYASGSNGNRLLGWSSVPTSDTQEPDFVVGSPGLTTNTLLTNNFITNPVPASNGKQLFVSSDFDRRLSIWRTIPSASGTAPDATFSFAGTYDGAPWDNTLFGDIFMAAGKNKIFVWTTLPTTGQNPDSLISGSAGGVTFDDLQGIAYDGRYTVVADVGAKRLYVWRGLPSASRAPVANIALTYGPGRVTSDGEWVAVTSTFEHGAYLYRIGDLVSGTVALGKFVGGPGQFNLPNASLVAGGRLFIGDLFHRVKVWNSIASAAAGQPHDLLLGKSSISDIKPRIGRNQLFWPAAMSYDGKFVWVGEFKFSGRLVAYQLR